jgi:transketolase
MKRLMPATVNHPGPIYIRLAKGGDPVVTDPSMPFRIDKAFAMKEGKDALIVSTGVMLKPSLEAAAALVASGISAGVLHAPVVKPFDQETFLRMAGPVPVVVTAEEHTVIGGLGSAVAELLAEAEFHHPKRFRRLGIPDIFPDHYGSQASLFTQFGLTAENIAGTVRELLKPKTG